MLQNHVTLHSHQNPTDVRPCGKMIIRLSGEQQFGPMLNTSMLLLGITTHTTILSKTTHCSMNHTVTDVLVTMSPMDEWCTWVILICTQVINVSPLARRNRSLWMPTIYYCESCGPVETICPKKSSLDHWCCKGDGHMSQNKLAE
jgi:hypothetical protein